MPNECVAKYNLNMFCNVHFFSITFNLQDLKHNQLGQTFNDITCDLEKSLSNPLVGPEHNRIFCEIL